MGDRLSLAYAVLKLARDPCCVAETRNVMKKNPNTQLASEAGPTETSILREAYIATFAQLEHSVTKEPSQESIRERALALYGRSDCRDGRHLEYWIEAKEQLMAEALESGSSRSKTS